MISIAPSGGSAADSRGHPVTITLNGDPFDIDGPLTVTELLARLDIDPRRIAVEHNLIVLKRTAFDETVVNAGDQIEIVNFVGGGRW
jgi:sulfur carrier protein